jgi:hypothetical protein
VSLANLDLVRSIFAPWECGDWSSAEWAHPEIEFVIADGPEPGSGTGLAGIAQGTRGLLGAWEDLRVVAEEYRELGDERVLVLAHRSGRPRPPRTPTGTRFLPWRTTHPSGSPVAWP